MISRADDPREMADDEAVKRADNISDWDAEFCKVDQGTLFELILVCVVSFCPCSPV